MSSLRDIRSKISSIENIKKITQAMERVAAVHLRRAQKKAEQSLPYAKKLRAMLDILVALGIDHPLFAVRPVKKTALVVIGADKGLCGSYNSNIIVAADKFLKDYPQEAVQVIPIGRKIVDYYQNKKWHIPFKMERWGGKITLAEIEDFSNQLVAWFLDGTFDEVWLIHTHYINVMRRSIVLEKFLNIAKTAESKEIKNLNFILEPNGEEILDQVLPRYFLTRIKLALDESYASELAARIVAMQAAYRNSEDLIETLTLTRNKMRQREITREMIEISSGAL